MPSNNWYDITNKELRYDIETIKRWLECADSMLLKEEEITSSTVRMNVLKFSKHYLIGVDYKLRGLITKLDFYLRGVQENEEKGEDS